MKEWQGHQGNVLDSVDDFDVINCKICGYKHIIPIPTAEELVEVYCNEYYSIEKPLYLSNTREDLEWWNLAYGDRYNVFEKFLPQNCRRILDIGSGPGFFLLQGKKRGWTTLGIEPSKQAAQHSRDMGLVIREEFLSKETAQNLGNFDVIHMSEVLEHISDPGEMVEIAFDLLNENGILCIVVPNEYNPLQQAVCEVSKAAPWWVAPPHHINYFDRESLSELLSKKGFDVLLCEGTFPIDLFLLMGDNYIGNDPVGRQCHGKRMQFEMNLAKAGLNDLKRKIYEDLIKHNIGREIVIYARKQ